MNRITNLLIALILCAGLTAGNTRKLDWKIIQRSGEAVLDFKGSVHINDSPLPTYIEVQSPDIAATAYKARLIFPQFEKLSSKELHLVKKSFKNLSDSIEITIHMGTERKKQVLDLTFLPFVKRGGDYYKLVSFDWEIKPIVGLRSANATTMALPAVTTSALTTGKWKKISVEETGLYKLSYSDLVSMGLDPQKAQIYGFGGALLEENFSIAGYRDDLPEVAVWKELGKDGVFNQGDFMLFYAKGPVNWTYDKAGKLFRRIRNHYSDKAYYFVGERSNGTKTVNLSAFEGLSTQKVTTFTDYFLHETERVNMGESVSGNGTGRLIIGEDFTSMPTQTYTFAIPNADSSQLASVQVDFAANNTGTSSCRVYSNNARLGALTLPAVNSDYRYGSLASSTYTFFPKNPTNAIRLEYVKSGNSTSHRACLDYIAINVVRKLKMTGGYLLFRNPNVLGAGQIGEYTVQNANPTMVVLDVTDPQEPVQMKTTLNGTTLSFNAPADVLREFVCVDLNGAIQTPTVEGSVPNQNIHSHTQPDMVIVSPQEFLTQANQLAQAHVTYDNLSVMVVTPEQIYNEFSSGTPDATAYRRMMKYFYDKAGTQEDQMPKYLLLFGDGVYDNRLVSTKFSGSSFKPNKILTYQSVESMDGSASFVTDDYYGFLDTSEGVNLGMDKLDIGIGRFPVSSVDQAKVAVDKTIAYMTNAKKGVWKNRLLYVADDGNDYIHEDQADDLASSIESQYPDFMINKIYVDAYPKVTTASGTTVPEANKRFKELLNSGLLMVNYTGHGATYQWAEEKILTLAEIKAMTNKCLPLWVTATCDFTRYDAPESTGGEELFLNPYGGGIGLFTTTRMVYSHSNFLLNTSFCENIFARDNGIRYTLGQIMNRSKRSSDLSGDSNKLSFTLIGDPALKLGYPQYSAKVTEINGVQVTGKIDTLHALSSVTIRGELFKEDGSFASDFNGVICPTILDARSELMSWSINKGSVTTYYDRSKVLFSGKDSIRNGRFSFTFVVPKDISYSTNTGVINLYAYDDKGLNEAQGFYQNVILTGTDTTANSNRTGPEIELYLNNFNFKSGGLVNEKPTLLAVVTDENGLNTSGNGIGHDLMLNIDGFPAMTYNLNNDFTSSTGSFTTGLVEYALPELKNGKHFLSLKAWDVQNNSSVDTLWFQVQKGLDPEVSDLKFTQKGDQSFFWFTHDRPDVYVGVKLHIYDLMGRVIWSSDWVMQTESNVSDKLEWNLTDSYGRRVSNGIYICKVVLTDASGAQTTKAEKIQITKQ